MTTQNQPPGNTEQFMDERGGDNDIRAVNINLPAPQQPNVSLELDPDNGWTPFKERMVRSSRLNSIKYRWMHKEAIKYYSRRRKVAEILNIILGSVGTLLSIWSNDVTVQMTKVIVVLSAFVSIMITTLNFPQLQVQHTVASKKFLELFNAAQIQLLAPRQERAHAQIFVQELIKGFSALEGASPEIPKRVKNYLKEHPEVITELYSFHFDPDQNESESAQLNEGPVNVVPMYARNDAAAESQSPQLNPDLAARFTQLQLQRNNFSPFATDMSD